MSWPLFDVCIAMFFLQVLFNQSVASGRRVVIKVCHLPLLHHLVLWAILRILCACSVWPWHVNLMLTNIICAAHLWVNNNDKRIAHESLGSEACVLIFC